MGLSTSNILPDKGVEVLEGAIASAAAIGTSEAIAKVTGQSAKALISVRDERDYQKAGLKINEMEKLRVHHPATAGLGPVGNLTEAAKAVATSNLVEMGLEALGVKVAKGGYTRSMEVQFNPSSIRLSGFAGDEDVSISEFSQGEGGSIRSGSVGAQVELSFKLIFDHISNTAAFQQDLLLLMNASSLASAAGQKLMDAIKGRTKNSVQITVEAFIACLRNDKTRTVCFEWGDMRYEGVLRQINTAYTMFDMNGLPVRAEVGVNMYLVETEEKTLKDYSNGYWYNAYKAAFITGNPVAELAMEFGDLEFDD
jgi:hypothetical protein